MMHLISLLTQWSGDEDNAMDRDVRMLMQSYMLLMSRTIEILTDEEIMRLESDKKWRFYYNMAMENKQKIETRSQKPN